MLLGHMISSHRNMTVNMWNINFMPSLLSLSPSFFLSLSLSGTEKAFR